MIKKQLCIAFLFLSFSTVFGQAQIPRIEASFIANFMRYIQWPNQANLSTIKIGVYGQNTPIFEELSKNIAGKNVGTATIEVVEVTDQANFKDYQLVFVPNGKSGRVRKVAKTLNANPVLFITEEQDYHPDYSIINFRIENSKLTFQLKNDLAKAKDISISSRLVQMSSN